jgi:hypothetical protein
MSAHDIAAAIWHHAQTAPERPLSREQLAALEVDGDTLLAPTGRRRVDRSAPGRLVADELGYEGSVWNPDGGDLDG